MLLSPVATVDVTARAAPVAVRLIGVLDRVLVESFSDACAGLFSTGRRRLIVSLRDLLAVRDETLHRFLATLEAYRDAGHDIRLEATPSWRRLLHERRAAFPVADDEDGRRTRRQIIIAHSTEKRAGAA